MMKKLVLAVALGSAGVFSLSACGGKKEEPVVTAPEEFSPASAIEAMSQMANGDAKATGPMKMYADGMNQIADAVEKAKDEASARRAAQSIAATAKDMKDLSEQLEKMSDAEKSMMVMSNMGAITQSSARMASAMLTLQSEHPELMEILQDEIDKVPAL